MTVAEVGVALTRGALKLGFERARLFRVEVGEGDAITFVGVSQAGSALPGFASMKTTWEKSVYLRKAFPAEAPLYFTGEELGAGCLTRHYGDAGFQLPVGEWTCLPLRDEHNGKCLGVLTLDNAQQPRTISPNLRALLGVFRQQATVALEHAVHHEVEQRKLAALEIVSSARQQAAAQRKEEGLDALLSALYEQLANRIPCHNFLVLLANAQSEWFEYVFQVDQGQRLPRSWRKRTAGGLVMHVAQLQQPLFLPEGVKEYREQHTIPQVGMGEAQSFMAVPLQVNESLIGVLARPRFPASAATKAASSAASGRRPWSTV